MDNNLNFAAIFRNYADKIQQKLRLGLFLIFSLYLLLNALNVYSAQAGKITLTKTKPLPNLNLEPKITVSGLSSGGYMANQFHMAYAEEIDGVGIIGAGPYFCSEGSLKTAINQCLAKDLNPDVITALAQLSANTAKMNAESGNLAKLTALADDKIWIFHGSADNTVSATVTEALVDFYKDIIPENNWKNIVYVNNIRAGHGFPITGDTTECAVTESPFINKCNYDGAGEMLQHLYGNLNKPVTPDSSRLQPFDQYLYNAEKSTLGKKGFIYIPQNCLDGALCRLHISFHGCRQSVKFVGDRYLTETGFNGWAESNNLVILYPQAAVSAANLNACWDWWGYTNENFAQKNGLQIQSIWKMVQALQGQA